MPQVNWHIIKRLHDLDTSNLLSSNSPNYLDWEVITLFYSALHYVDCAICKKRLAGAPVPEPVDHKHRRKLVVKHFRPIATDYSMLESISQWARYEGVVITPTMVGTAKSIYSSIVTYLQTNFP
jgi:hypothetical protein